MDIYRIRGGRKLHGEIKISGAKNAAASILPGALLVNGICRIRNVPDIDDVRLTIEIMEGLGAKIRWLSPDCIEVDSREISSQTVPVSLGTRMRASHFFIGSLLGRSGKANVPLPGGCDLGTRPIDQHLKGFAAMGAEYTVDDEMVRVSIKNGRRLKGAQIRFDMVTVGATMNLMLAAALAEGVTVLRNSAREPHIVDLAGFLNTMGADISGAGTDEIIIKGVPALKEGTYDLIPDQIEAGTFMAAAAAAGGSIRLSGVIPAHLKCISDPFRQMGLEITEGDDFLIVSKSGDLQGIDIQTRPYPGFPTDMQPQMGAVMCLAKGRSTITENIWEDRLRYTSQLRRMGADINVSGRMAVFNGTDLLNGTSVEACDLRAGAALVIAALAAKGETRIGNIGFIERGYHDLPGKLAALGAEISRIKEEDLCGQNAGSGQRKHPSFRFRFTMPDPALDKTARIKALAEQFDAYIESDAMHSLLNLLDTDIKGLADKYNMRRKKDGGVRETQELGPGFSLEEKKADLYPLFAELGFFDINKPLSSEYSRILIMGASLTSTYHKTKCSAEWITPRVVSVDALSCFRPLNPIERTASGFRTDSDTEFGAASDSFVSVFGLDRGKWQDDFCGDRNLNRISCIRTYPEQTDGRAFRIFAAPSTESSNRRADTGDAIKYYLENAGLRPGESLLVITSNRYCNRQFVQLAYQIIKSDFPVSLDIIGCCGDEEIVSVKKYDPCQYIQDIIAAIDWIGRFKREFSI